MKLSCRLSHTEGGFQLAKTVPFVLDLSLADLRGVVVTRFNGVVVLHVAASLAVQYNVVRVGDLVVIGRRWRVIFR